MNVFETTDYHPLTKCNRHGIYCYMSIRQNFRTCTLVMSHLKYLQPSACRRPPARARIGRQLNDTIPCSIILVGALEVHIWLGEFVDVYFKVV